MQKRFAIGIMAAAAAMVISSAASMAKDIECLTIDKNISFSSPKLMQDDYEMNCVLSSSQIIEVADDKESFRLTSGNYSFYKTNIQTMKPASFKASGEQLCTVFETRFRATLMDENVDDYIPTMTYGMYVTAGGSSTFVGEGESQKRTMPVDGTEYTIKYVINPVKKEVKEYRNDELITTTAFEAVGSGDITQIRFYPRPLAGKNAAGEYNKPNNKNVLDYAGDDGVVALSTPIIWDFDYMRVYQIPPYEIESADPADGATGVTIGGPYMVTFDRNMNEDTFDYSSVQMINDETGEVLMTVPMMFEPNVCTIYPAGMVEYFTKYHLNFSSAVKDENGFSNEGTAKTGFTTEKRPITEKVIYADASSPVSLSCGNVLAAGSITGTMKLRSTADDQTVRVIAAIYDKNNTGYVFNKKAEKNITLSKGETVVDLPELTVTDAGKQIIKYMVWDETGYPLTDAVVCDSEHIGI